MAVDRGSDGSAPGGRPIVLFLSRTFSVFALRDRDILEEEYDIESVQATRNLPRLMLEMWRGLSRASLLYVYFAGWHALLALLLARVRKVSVVLVTGGYDVTCVPEISYGARCSGWQEAVSRYVLEHADLVLPFSESARREVLEFATPRDMRTLHFGFRPERFEPRGEREDIVVSVGNIKASNMRRKGHGTFVDAAQYLPDTRFILVGGSEDGGLEELKSRASANVEFTGAMDNDDVIDLLWRSQVYVQVSGHEGFGCSLAEAMLCGCVPVVTKRFAIPEVVGDTGYYVPFEDPEATAEAIRTALADRERGRLARERVLERFPHTKRRDALLAAVGRLIERGR
ncbi:MAG: glycosyltransferase family 4 protein [Candidatus Undinarchaeales archaeon]|nr:glycosyltransferase family 4 protein [Candidatus Undinarchaeales archaeon]